MTNPSRQSAQAAVARYFATCQPQLRAFIRALIFNPSDVDDVLQEVAVVAIEKADRFDSSKGDVGAWVMGIARNRVLKYLEKSKRQQLCFSSTVVDAIADAAKPNDELANTLDALEDCLNLLGKEKRELLLRRHAPGMTASQLAKEVSYTDSRMSRMLNGLYATLMKCVRQNMSIS